MPSDLQVSNIKDLTGSNTGLSIASDGQVTIAQNNPTVTLGSNARLPQNAIANVHCSTSNVTPYTPQSNFTTVAGGSSVSYTPATGARFVVYQYITTWDNDDARSILSFKLQLDSQNFATHLAGWDSVNLGTAGSNTISVGVVLTLSSITTDFSGHSSGHNWQTNAGGTSAFSAGTLRLMVATYDSSYEATLCRLANSGGASSDQTTRPTTLIYSVM